MLRMKAGMSVYDWICLSWDSWSTLIRVHSALCRFLETCSYGRVERGRKMSKHLAATTVTTASSWNWFTGTNSVILFLADLGSICRVWELICLSHSFESRICSMGRRENGTTTGSISLGLRLSSYLFPIAVSEMIKSHSKCQFTTGPCKLHVLQQCAKKAVYPPSMRE